MIPKEKIKKVEKKREIRIINFPIILGISILLGTLFSIISALRYYNYIGIHGISSFLNYFLILFIVFGPLIGLIFSIIEVAGNRTKLSIAGLILNIINLILLAGYLIFLGLMMSIGG